MKASAIPDPFQNDLLAIHPALQWRISTRAKRMALRLDPQTGRIHLVVPKRASLKKALDFARSYRSWIDKQTRARPEGIPFHNGAVLPVLGRERTLVIRQDTKLKRTTVTLTDDTILVLSNQADPSLRIIRFLKRLAQDEITRLAQAKAQRIRREINAITIRDTATRWGSCSQDGNLSFSWRLLLAPLPALDYVVAHEVAHLTHLNHGVRFWTLCEKLSADFETGHGWMKKNAHTLMRYGCP